MARTDLAGGRPAPLQVLFRSGTLIALVWLMGLAVAGTVARSEQYTSADGVVQVVHPLSAGADAEVDVVVTLEPQTCEQLEITLDRSYLRVITDLALTPTPDAQNSTDARHTWRFDGENPGRVHITGHATRAWGPPARGVLTVACGSTYEVDLLTTRLL